MAWGGLFLSWSRPSLEQQKACLALVGDFNYDPSLRGASAPCSKSQGTADVDNERLKATALTQNGFFINRSRVLLGSGPATFCRAKSALLSWRHFGLGWAAVDPETPVVPGTKFCVCLKELLPWVMMPLQIAYVADDSSTTSPKGASFSFGSGTLQGHLLAGEERFSVQWDEYDQVWYEIFSFSKPSHILSVICYPYVQLRQKYFARHSARALLKHVAAERSYS